MDNREIYIKSKNKALDFEIKETWKYKDLIGLFIKRDFSLIYKQTILGPAWLVIQPLANGLILAAIFGHALGIPTDGIPQFLFYLSGTAIWTLFSTCARNISETFVSQSYLLSKIYFPRLTIPVSQGATSLLMFLIQFGLLILVCIYYAFTGWQFHITPLILLIPVLLVQTVLLATGVGLVITSLTIRYRDLALATPFVIQIWMYATPVVYSLTQMSGTTRTILLANPMTPIVNNFRYCIFGTGVLLVKPWIISIVITVILLLGGILLFNKSERSFVDII